MPRTLQILLAGRKREELAIVEALAMGAAQWQVETRLITNGHVDPLYQVQDLPDVLLFILSANWEEELRVLAERPAAARPPTLIIGPQDNTRAMRLAMRSGARDYFTFPIPERDLGEVLAHIEAERITEAAPAGSRLVAVVSAKGGAGASVVATNLAAILAAERRKVALVDMDLQTGVLPLLLDLHPVGGGLAEAVGRASEIDEVAIEGYMLRHESGVRLLAPGDGLSPDHRLPPANVERIVELLQNGYEHVIADVPRHFNAATAVVLSAADKILLTLQQDVAHLREATRFVDIAERYFAVERERIVVVVNRWQRQAPVSLDDIGKALGGGLTIVKIPNDFERVSASINSGIPVVTASPRGAFRKGMQALEQSLERKAEKSRGGLLGLRLLGLGRG